MTPKPFLYLYNWHESQRESRFDRALATSGLAVEVYRTNRNEFPVDYDFCGVYLSPSFDSAYDDLPWVQRLHELLPKLAKRKIPMIGLCFGCQVLASALVSKDAVFKRAEHEGGHGTISLTTAAKADPICRHVPEMFDVFHWHSDEVCANRDDMEILAHGSNCNNHLWRWRKGPVWGVQPHPEMDADDLRQWLTQNRTRIRMAGHDVDDYLPQCLTSNSGFTVLENFIQLVIERNTAVTGTTN
ncbi:MAG: type 1 glutamine amidotransferase [Aestuariivita sp.]|nr:type 1 glutamine amidotransferase [Aestuariivita sp.]MCY4203755.1 type 1 glutamine amidotransferase [Aestuariivita sp.]